MAKLRHIAIQTKDPAAAAEFYTKVFGMQEIERMGDLATHGGIALSDGTVNVTLMNVTNPDYPNFLPQGLNHIGFVVDDTAEVAAAAKELGGIDLIDKNIDSDSQDEETYEYKMRTPDGVAFDLSTHGWAGIKVD